MLIFGIDPGGRDTGFCMIDDERRVVAACVITRTGDDWLAYMKELIEWALPKIEREDTKVAIEKVNAPSWHMGGEERPMNPKWLIGVSRVLGLFEGLCVERDLIPILIPPGNNGSGALDAYPKQLVGPRETKGGGILRHTRSAFDVAIRAQELLKPKYPRGFPKPVVLPDMNPVHVEQQKRMAQEHFESLRHDLEISTHKTATADN